LGELDALIVLFDGAVEGETHQAELPAEVR